MSRVRVVYTESAYKDLKKLEKSQIKRILEKVRFYAENEDMITYAKKLKPPLERYYRFKVGQYRVIFLIDREGNMSVLVVLKVAHRKDVYQ